MLFLILAWRTWVPRVRRYFFLSSSPGVFGYGSVCHEPLPITNISSRFFRRRGEGCHFRFRAPANHLASTSPPPGQAILLGLLDVTQVRLLLIQTAVIPLPSSQWDITWHRKSSMLPKGTNLWANSNGAPFTKRDCFISARHFCNSPSKRPFTESLHEHPKNQLQAYNHILNTVLLSSFTLKVRSISLSTRKGREQMQSQILGLVTYQLYNSRRLVRNPLNRSAHYPSRSGHWTCIRLHIQ